VALARARARIAWRERSANHTDYDLGYFDDETCRLEPIENPFGPEGVTYASGMICYPCL